MKKITTLALTVLVYSAPAYASFGEEVKQLPINIVMVGVAAIRLTDSACHLVWNTFHNQLIHPLASAIAETAEVVTFKTVDLNGDGS